MNSIRRALTHLVLALVVAPAHAQNVEISLPQLAAQPGETVDVPLSVSFVPQLLGYFVDVRYNSNILTFDSLLAGSLTSSFPPQVNATSPGTLIFTAAGNNAVSGAGTLAVIRLTVKSTALVGQSSQLLLLEADINDGAIPLSAVDGQLLVGSVVQIRVPAMTTLTPGSEFDLPITLSDGNFVFGYVFEISFDPDVIQVIDVLNGNLTQDWSAPQFNFTGTNTLVVAGVHSMPLDPGGGSIVRIRFRDHATSQPGDISPVSFIDAELNDGQILSNTLGGIVGIIGCCRDGDVNLDCQVTPSDALLAFEQFLQITSLSECQRYHADVSGASIPPSVTPSDALCMFERFLQRPSSCITSFPKDCSCED